MSIKPSNENDPLVDANHRHNSVKKDHENKNMFQDKKETVKKSSVKLDR